MPIYEYECRKCKAHVEILQKITDKALAKCPKCGGRLDKQWSATSFQFKGTGWYVTDYANKKADAKEEIKSANSEAATASDKVATDKASDKVTSKETPAAKKSSATKNASSSDRASGD